MNRAEFENAYRQLVASFGKQTHNVGCLACEDCERSTDSTFCKRCKGVTRCHYCDGCVDCTDSSHCTRCTGCLGCTHCIESERCIGSAYLVRCVGLSGCTYCFGCVGLSKRDFHILNEPYDRKTYFEIVGKLMKELRLA